MPSVNEALAQARSMIEPNISSALAEGHFGPEGSPPFNAVKMLLDRARAERDEERDDKAIEIAASARKDARDARIIALIAAAIASATAIITAYVKFIP